MKFAVSSHINYFDKTKPILHDSLLKCGIEESDIYYFISNPEVSEYTKVNDNQYYINHNSFDFNGLISVIDLSLFFDRWFFLHDTCYVGKNFKNFLSNYDHLNKNFVGLICPPKPNMNIGSISWEGIQIIKNEVLSKFKNFNFDKNVSNLFKTMLVDNEGYFFKKSSFFYTDSVISSDPNNLIYNKNMRIIEHYPNLDLYKVKANWATKVDWTLDL